MRTIRCVLATAIALAVFKGATGARLISPISRTQLATTDLHVIVLEPNLVSSDIFRTYLNDKRRQRLQNLKDGVSEGFRSVRFSMIKVTDTDHYDEFDDDDKLACIKAPTQDVADFAQLMVQEDSTGTRSMLLAAALTGQRLGLTGRFKTEKGKQILRVIIMFAEVYVDEPNSFNTFVGDGSDTCFSGFSSAEATKQQLSKDGIDKILLVTPRRRLRDEWETAFDPEDVLVYPNEARLDSSIESFDYDSSDDQVVAFAKERIKTFAESRFSSSSGLRPEDDTEAQKPATDDFHKQTNLEVGTKIEVPIESKVQTETTPTTPTETTPAIQTETTTPSTSTKTTTPSTSTKTTTSSTSTKTAPMSRTEPTLTTPQVQEARTATTTLLVRPADVAAVTSSSVARSLRSQFFVLIATLLMVSRL